MVRLLSLCWAKKNSADSLISLGCNNHNQNHTAGRFGSSRAARPLPVGRAVCASGRRRGGRTGLFATEVRRGRKHTTRRQQRQQQQQRQQRHISAIKVLSALSLRTKSAATTATIATFATLSAAPRAQTGSWFWPRPHVCLLLARACY